LLLAHVDPHRLRKAVDAVAIEFDRCHLCFPSRIASAARKHLGSDNLFKTFLIEKGNLEDVLG